VAAGGIILLNLTFVAYFLFVSALDVVLPGKGGDAHDWVRALELGLFVLLVGSVSWWVLRSGLRSLLKAAYLTVPLGVAYASLGVLLSRWPGVAVALGIVFFAVVLGYLRRSAQPWIYIYALVLVSVAMLAITLTGTDI
jgi:hypothetical protein